MIGAICNWGHLVPWKMMMLLKHLLLIVDIISSIYSSVFLMNFTIGFFVYNCGMFS
jgi:hypothetical protein